MITAPELEIAVLLLGMAILMVESFATRIDRRFLAFAAIAGLAAVAFTPRTGWRSSLSSSGY